MPDPHPELESIPVTPDERRVRELLGLYDTQHLPCHEWTPLLAFKDRCLNCGHPKTLHRAHDWLMGLLATRAAAEDAEALAGLTAAVINRLKTQLLAVQAVVDHSEPAPPGGQHVGPPKYSMTPSTRKELRRILLQAIEEGNP